MIVFGQLFSPTFGGLVNNALQTFLGGLSCSFRNSCVYIQDDNHDKENIVDQNNIEKISSEEIVNSQKLDTAEKVEYHLTFVG